MRLKCDGCDRNYSGTGSVVAGIRADHFLKPGEPGNNTMCPGTWRPVPEPAPPPPWSTAPKPAPPRPAAKSLGQVVKDCFYALPIGIQPDAKVWQGIADAVVAAFVAGASPVCPECQIKREPVPVPPVACDHRHLTMGLADASQRLDGMRLELATMATENAYLRRELLLAKGKARGQR